MSEDNFDTNNVKFRVHLRFYIREDYLDFLKWKYRNVQVEKI